MTPEELVKAMNIPAGYEIVGFREAEYQDWYFNPLFPENGVRRWPGITRDSWKYIILRKLPEPEDDLERRAIEESIAHYERMRDHPGCGEMPIAQHCPLCKKYLRPLDTEPHCLGCPVSRRTGEPSCKGSPWFWAMQAFFYHPDAWPQCAQAEIDFLRSLLPAPEPEWPQEKPTPAAMALQEAEHVRDCLLESQALVQRGIDELNGTIGRLKELAGDAV